MFRQSSFFREVPPTIAEEDWLLAVVPLGVTRHPVVAHGTFTTFAALVHLVLVPSVLHQGLVVGKLCVTIRAKKNSRVG